MQFMKNSPQVDKIRAEKFQRDLEQTMTLLIFESLCQKDEASKNDTSVFDKLPQHLKDLLDFTNRQRLASWVNEIILETMGYQSEHQLGFYW